MKNSYNNFLTLAAMVVTFSCKAAPDSNVVCWVNDNEILSSEYFLYHDEVLFNNMSLTEKEQQVDSYVTKKLFIEEAKKLNIHKIMSIYDGENYFLDNLLIDATIEEKVWKPLFLPNNLQNLYTRLKKEIGVKHIIIPFKDCIRTRSKRTKEDALSLVQNVRGKIVDGELTFGEAALRYSEDPSALDFGDLGYYGWGEGLFEPLQSTAFDLNLREISPPLLSKFGYHIVFVYGIRTKQLPPLKEYKTELVTFLRSQQGPEFKKSLSSFEIELSEKYSIWINEKLLSNSYDEINKQSNNQFNMITFLDKNISGTVCKIDNFDYSVDWLKGEIHKNKPIAKDLIYTKEHLMQNIRDTIFRYLAKIEYSSLNANKLTNIRSKAFDQYYSAMGKGFSKFYPKLNIVELSDSLMTSNIITLNINSFHQKN